MYPEERKLTKEEQGWLHLLDEELALPPLPPDFVSNILARLGIPSSVLEETHEPTNSAPYSEMPEEFCQRGREARDHKNYTLAVELFRQAGELGGINAEKWLEITKSLQKGFPEVLKTLSAIQPQSTSASAEIKYFKGLNAVRKLYEEAFNGNEMRSYIRVDEEDTLFPDNMIVFDKALKKNKKLKMWEIAYESFASREEDMMLEALEENYFCKFMPKDLEWSLTSEDIVIFDGKIAIINYTGKVSTIVLQSPDFYNNLKEMFDFIWRILPEPTFAVD